MNLPLTLTVLVLITLNVAQSKHMHAKPKSLEAIYREIKGYIKRNPRVASIDEIGQSFEGRPIYCVKIQDRSVKIRKRIVVNFGIHAREWASQRSGLFIIRQLLTNRNLRHYINTTEWFIVPVLNPDGYHYSTTKMSLWRKNRRPLPSSKCVGVDLNRNYPIGWEKDLSGKDQWCQSVYSGPNPMSEPESQVLKGLLTTIKYTDAYVDVHACAQSILYPYGYTKDKPPKGKLRNLIRAAHAMKGAMKKVSGTNYVVQSAADLYVAGGGSDDFAFEEFKIPMVFTLELGDDVLSARNCFHPTAERMNRLERECLQGMLALSRFLHSKKGSSQKKSNKPLRRKMTNTAARSDKHTPSTIIVFIGLLQLLLAKTPSQWLLILPFHICNSIRNDLSS